MPRKKSKRTYQKPTRQTGTKLPRAQKSVGGSRQRASSGVGQPNPPPGSAIGNQPMMGTGKSPPKRRKKARRKGESQAAYRKRSGRY